MIRLISIIIFITIITVILPPAKALDSTPSADIKAKLEDLKKEIASKAAQLKQLVDQKLKDKTYIGTLKTKSASALTLATRNGPRIVNSNQDTVFESQVKGGGKFSQKTLTEEDYLAALGDVDETQVLTAKKIILMPQPKTGSSADKTYLWGQILSISDKLVTLKDRNLKNIAVSAVSDKISVGEFVILTGTFGKNDIFEAQFTYVIPQGGFIKPKKQATPSAQIATHSASPSASKRKP